MHYYLRLEVWQKPDKIIVGQRKYIIKILQKFRMMDCKSMPTPTVTNLRNLTDSEFDLVDPSMYEKLIGLLMYLVNTRANICFAVNTLSQF